MINQRYQPNTQSGFSTLELLIAFMVMTVSLVALIQVVFGNQSIAIDTNLAQRGLYLAERNLEAAGILAIGSFNDVESTPTSTPADQPFSSKIDVLDISPCAKQVTSKVSWGRNTRNLSTSLSSTVVSTTTAQQGGGNCASTLPNADWDTTEAYGGVSASDFDAQGTGVAIANIDGSRYAFLTTNAATPGQNNFYAINTNDPENVTFTGIKITEEALNGVVVATVNGAPYAFVLRNDQISGELQVVDLSNPNNPTYLPTASTTLQTNSNADATPYSIFYYDEKIYIGTEYLVSGLDDELHIIDVSDPTAPVWESSIDVDRSVYDLYVDGENIYTANGPGTSAPYDPLKIFDRSTLSEIGSFEISENRSGNAVYVLGDTLYLALSDEPSEHDFYILDVEDPTAPTELGSTDFSNNHSDVGDIVVSGRFAFVGVEGTNSQHTFQVLNVYDPTDIWRVNPQACVGPQAQQMSGIAYADNLIFGSFRSSETFRIIFDTLDVCTAY